MIDYNEIRANMYAVAQNSGIPINLINGFRDLCPVQNPA